MKNLFFVLSLIFAAIFMILMLGSRPTDLGPGVIPFALPSAVCAAGFAIAAAITTIKDPYD